MDAASLSRLTRRLFGHDAGAPKRLSGGASMESWRFEAGSEAYVLRRLPEGASLEAAIAGLPLSTEAAIIRLARAHGVRAPEVVTELTADDSLGTGYVMRAVAGETLPHKILGNPDFASTGLTRECAREIARIHALPTETVRELLTHKSTHRMVADLRELYASTGAAIPAFDVTFAWLESHLPSEVEPRLLHGDFRMGNLMIDADGVAGVLDWELTHLGDPAQDIGFLCAPSWRFGHWENEVGGFGDLDSFLSAYRKAGGAEVSPGRVRFWEIYSSLWWGLVCIQMVELWRKGVVRTLERPVIGTRVSETEVDLLLLLDMHGGEGRVEPFAFPYPEAASHTGDTAPAELLEALSEWTSGLVAESSGHAKFEARIARNALGIARRAALHGPPPEVTDLQSLHKDVLHRLRIDQPKYAGLRVAEGRWLL